MDQQVKALSSALAGTTAIAWGERAMGFLGVPLVCQHHTLVIDDADLEDAMQKLRSAGFQACSWSYGSREPKFYQGKGAKFENIYHRITTDYHNFDQNCPRFLFPPEHDPVAGKKLSPSEGSVTWEQTRLALLPSSYAHVSLKSTPDERFTRIENIFYPDNALLLESFIRVLVREPAGGLWKGTLGMWAVAYVYGELMVADDVLDSCDDEAVKSWFNENINRFTGGIDRITDTKRLGKVRSKPWDPRVTRGQ